MTEKKLMTLMGKLRNTVKAENIFEILESVETS